jgi:hypothetical protein
MCVGAWYDAGYVKPRDIRTVTVLPEVVGNGEVLAEEWDAII